MFSVIIPVFNGEEFIENAINSVFAQTVSDWELIIVNDGSTDNTSSVLEKYKDNEKIKIVSQPNSGVSVARNTGFENSKGDYIAFLDADDVWHENHLEVMQAMADKYPSAGLIGTFTRVELVNHDIISECAYFKNKTKEVFLEDFFAEYHRDKSAKMFTVITTVVSREAFRKAGGFPVGCKIGEDLELSLVVAAYYPVVLSPIATATYKKENSTATKTKSFDADWGFFDRVRQIYEDDSIPSAKRENLKKVMDWFSMRRCRHYLIDGKRKAAKEVHRRMNKASISKKDYLLNVILFFLPTELVRKLFEVRWRGKA